MLQKLKNWATRIDKTTLQTKASLDEIRRQIASLQTTIHAVQAVPREPQSAAPPREHSFSASSSEVHAAIKSVWNDYEDEEYRKDQSHWRGHGRWAEPGRWEGIGSGTLKKVEKLWRIAGRDLRTMQHLTILEWGPGGGANAFGLRGIANRYYGVDISEKNLGETERVMAEAGRPDYFLGHLIKGAPELSDDVRGVDLFVSIAVFQHFPTNEYGADVLRAARGACKDDALAVIQFRYDNDNPRYKSISDLAEYKRKHITANSYPLDQFWNMAAECGFSPLAIDSIRTANNYATIYLRAAGRGPEGQGRDDGVCPQG